MAKEFSEPHACDRGDQEDAFKADVDDPGFFVETFPDGGQRQRGHRQQTRFQKGNRLQPKPLQRVAEPGESKPGEQVAQGATARYSHRENLLRASIQSSGTARVITISPLIARTSSERTPAWYSIKRPPCARAPNRTAASTPPMG